MSIWLASLVLVINVIAAVSAVSALLIVVDTRWGLNHVLEKLRLIDTDIRYIANVAKINLPQRNNPERKTQ